MVRLVWQEPQCGVILREDRLCGTEGDAEGAEEGAEEGVYAMGEGSTTNTTTTAAAAAAATTAAATTTAASATSISISISISTATATQGNGKHGGKEEGKAEGGEQGEEQGEDGGEDGEALERLSAAAFFRRLSAWLQRCDGHLAAAVASLLALQQLPQPSPQLGPPAPLQPRAYESTSLTPALCTASTPRGAEPSPFLPLLNHMQQQSQAEEAEPTPPPQHQQQQSSPPLRVPPPRELPLLSLPARPLLVHGRHSCHELRGFCDDQASDDQAAGMGDCLPTAPPHDGAAAPPVAPCGAGGALLLARLEELLGLECVGRLLFSEQLCDAEAAHVPRGTSPVPVRRSLRASSTARPHGAKAQAAEAAEAAGAAGAALGRRLPAAQSHLM